MINGTFQTLSQPSGFHPWRDLPSGAFTGQGDQRADAEPLSEDIAEDDAPAGRVIWPRVWPGL
jgi:hypothetical protein